MQTLISAAKAVVDSALKQAAPDNVEPGKHGRWNVRHLPIAAKTKVKVEFGWYATGRTAANFAQEQEASRVTIDDLKFSFFTIFERSRRSAARKKWTGTARQWGDDLAKDVAQDPAKLRWTYSRSTDLSYGGARQIAKAIATDMGKQLPFTIEGQAGANTTLTVKRATGEQIGVITVGDQDIFWMQPGTTISTGSSTIITPPIPHYSNSGHVSATFVPDATPAELQTASNLLNSWCCGRSTPGLA